MRRSFLFGALLGLALLAAPLGTAAAASPTVRLSILHTVHGCHVWMSTKVLGPVTTLRVKPGTRVEIRPDCPMDFDFAQVAGPRVALGDARTVRGNSRTFVFRKRGVYRFTVTNVQTPEEVGLQTLGPANVLTLTVVVR
jgi:hypothetical protein